MKNVLLFCTLLILMVSPAAAKTLSRVVAVVNNEIISSYQLDKEVQAVLDRNSSQPTSEQLEQLREQVLNKLIEDKLLEQRIKELGLRVSDPELNAAIEDVQRKNNLTAEMLKNAVEARGMPFEDYRNQLRQEILRYKLLGREVNYKVQVTSSEVRKYFNDHIDEYQLEPKVRVSSISYTLPSGSNEQDLAALVERAGRARDQLLSGSPFAEVLAAQGDDVVGGDMGYLVEADLTDQLRERLAGLEPGQVSEPVQVGDQLLMFLVTERASGDTDQFERVKGEIETLLQRQKTDARFTEWSQELRDRSYIDIRL